MIFEAFDVVVVPFPFTDRATTKRRPALVLSDRRVFNQPVGQVVLAMITSAKHSDWPLDVDLQDLDAAGLPSASIVRMETVHSGSIVDLAQGGVSGAVGPDIGTASSAPTSPP